MAEPKDALKPLRGAQALAAAPDAHVWLSASAGTGKTHVLTARVFRLLLNRVPPQNILCLTFTKAGASEMAERIHSRLAAWVQMDNVSLGQDLQALGEDYGPEARENARRLFAEVLEATGGGLRIQTIHSFCQQLLASFPSEAGLIPGFRALEDREQRELARNTLAELVLAAEASDNTALIHALQAMALRMGEKEAEAYLMRCAGAHDALDSLSDDIRAEIFGRLGLPQGDVEQSIADACADEAFDVDAVRRLAAANRAWAGVKGTNAAADMAAWMAMSGTDRAANLAMLLGSVFTQKGEPKVVSAKQLAAEPDFAQLAQEVGDRCMALLALRTQVAYAELASQALYAGRVFARAYAQAKRVAGVVDYDDLIARASDLLNMPGIGEWIRFKLDQQIDHILVDEAQDTNVRQWLIIKGLAEEFFAGEGARGNTLRTLFTVGDFKQAIFGFQGTSPLAFQRARRIFRGYADDAEHMFHDLSLDESFRSTPAVLELVDATLAQLGGEALGLTIGDIHHESANRFPGSVQLWKPVAANGGAPDDNGEIAEASDSEEDWLADHQRALAERIAQQIAAWISGGMMLESKGRPVRPGDVMILVRKRGDLARLIVARLYEAGVRVAGIDRLRLQSPLAVRDLMAALRFAAQPDDDLNLANLLVSPLVGWTQEELLTHSVPRKGNLWRHLRQAGDAPGLAALYDLLNQADFITPYRYLEHILSGPMQGRRKLLHRLGDEARDAVDELLQAALNFEQQEHPALQSFIDWFDREEGDIKRENDGRDDAVRLLTVHGAKGLQAPIVILADACGDPNRAGGLDRFDWATPDGDKLPLVPPRKNEQFGDIETAVAVQSRTDREEHWRLLYVAMTRAEEHLVLTGALGKRTRGVVPPDSWYAAAERAMIELGASWDADALWGGSCIWRGHAVFVPHPPAKAEAARRASPDLPHWLHSAAPVEARPPRPLAPTKEVEDDTAQPPPGPAMRAAAERGKLLHAMFERLPGVAAGERRDAAHRWLTNAAGVHDADVRAGLIDHALAVIEAPAYADIFAPDALAEAPIAAVVGEDVIAGIVDRLSVREGRIRLVDFKTGGRVPANVDAVPRAHLRQMAAYVAALEVIFPGRPVEAALLYTSGPTMIPLAPHLLAPHKPGFAPEQQSL
ncbi:MAG: double-strand break repair helicase AddA [Sphingobium sp.]